MTTHTLRLIDEYLTQGGHAPNIDADTLDREAALIAAAPDMLAALYKAQVSLCGAFNPRDRQALAAINDAITKATGA